MNYKTAKRRAQVYANKTGNSVCVYYDMVKAAQGIDAYDYDLMLPLFGRRIGDRIYPQSNQEREKE